MKKVAVVRLALLAVLLAAWLGWLGYLAATASRPVVVSRAQLLAADLVVLARVDDPEKAVVVEEVVFCRRGKRPAEGETLPVAGLGQCKRLPRGNERLDDVPPDWSGAGAYLVPLTLDSQTGAYAVTETPVKPASPGFDAFPGGPRRIYPATDETRAQLRQAFP